MFQKRTHLTQFRYYISYAKQIHNTYKSFLLAQQKMKKKKMEKAKSSYTIQPHYVIRHAWEEKNSKGKGRQTTMNMNMF